MSNVGEEIGEGMAGVSLWSLGYWVSFLSLSSRREELLGRTIEPRLGLGGVSPHHLR